jgi:hypothetical protein
VLILLVDKSADPLLHPLSFNVLVTILAIVVCS